MHPYAYVGKYLPMTKVLDVVYLPEFGCSVGIYRDIFGLTWGANRSWLGNPQKVNLEHLGDGELKSRLEPLRRISRNWMMEELLNKAGEEHAKSKEEHQCETTS